MTTSNHKNPSTTDMTKTTYIVLSVVVVLLVVVIGWFIYLIAKPATTTNTTVTTNQTNTATTAETNTNKKPNSNKANLNTNNANSNTNTTNNSNATNTAEDGLVQPDDETTEDTTTTAPTENADGTKTITLYYPKTSSTSCGEVYPVKRTVTPEEDFYGQVILEMMAGPATTDTGYTTKLPSGIRLRRVEYTSKGPLVTVNEAWDSLDDCTQATAEAQFIKTANAMFELPVSTGGEVVVGTVTTDDTATEDNNTNTTDTNTNE